MLSTASHSSAFIQQGIRRLFDRNFIVGVNIELLKAKNANRLGDLFWLNSTILVGIKSLHKRLRLLASFPPPFTIVFVIKSFECPVDGQRNIKKRNCLVVGGGAVGTRKVNTLLECGAKVGVVSPEPTQQLTKLASEGAISLERRAYRSSDLDGIFLVIGATDDEALNQQISSDAERRNTLCNIADRPDKCNFILPSIVRREDLVITVSTSGKSPALAKKLRKTLEVQFGSEYGDFLKLMGAIRSKLLSQDHEPEAHKPLFEQLINSDLISMIQNGKREEINKLLFEVLGDGFQFEELMRR